MLHYTSESRGRGHKLAYPKRRVYAAVYKVYHTGWYGRGHKLASLTQPTPCYTIHQRAKVGDINWRPLRGLVYASMYKVYHTGWYSRGHKLASLTQPTPCYTIHQKAKVGDIYWHLLLDQPPRYTFHQRAKVGNINWGTLRGLSMLQYTILYRWIAFLKNTLEN